MDWEEMRHALPEFLNGLRRESCDVRVHQDTVCECQGSEFRHPANDDGNQILDGMEPGTEELELGQGLE